jgi:hypothetical protein
MIAISYRRQDSSPVAGRLYDRLQAEFGKGNVFMDFDSIPYGVDFREHIKQTLQRAKVVVAIIGPEWIGGKEPANRRIDDPTDFVRLEVASALENGIPIIPVLVNNTPMPDAKNLPPELEGLAFRNGLALDTGIDFHHHADRLITGIRRVIDPAKDAAPVSHTAPTATPSIPTQKRSPLLSIVIIAALVAIAGIAAWYFLMREQRVAAIRESTPIAPPAISASPSSNNLAAIPQATAAATSISKASEPIAAITPPALEAEREYAYSGNIGKAAATFRLRFDKGGRVTGTYSQNGKTFRLEGNNPAGKLVLFEYTGEEKTARLELTRHDSDTEIRWDGTMFNISPNTNVYPVLFSRPR